MTALAGSLLVGLVPTAAQAAPTWDTYVAGSPADDTPHARDGKVHAIATVGGVTVAVGDFTQVRNQGTSTWSDRRFIMAFETATGRIIRGFDPEVSGSNVLDVIPAGDGRSVYVAGLFSAIDGLPKTRRLARIDVTTGEVMTGFKSPNFNSRASELALHDGTLYVGGAFTRSGGQDRTLLASVDATTGRLTDEVDLTFTGTFNGGARHVADMSMRPDGSRLVIIGNFTAVDGQRRPQIALVDLTGATATLDPWATERYGTRCSPSFDTYMWGVSASPDGSYFAIGTTGAYSGGPAAGTLCDTVARWEFGRSGAGQQPTWVSYTGGDTVTQVEVTDAAIYLGGHFRWLNNPWGNDSAGVGAVRRMGIGAMDPRNGLPTPWNPSRTRGWGVWGFTADEHGLWVGHDTDLLGRETHDRLGLFPVGTSRPPQDDTGSLPGDVYLAGAPRNGSSADDLRRVGFTGSSVTAQDDVDDLGAPWSQARATFMVDGKLYTAWSDGTMTHRNFTGRALGPQTQVQLRGMTAFANELRTMTSAWFDPDTARLYFTLAGDSSLYYRPFLTQGKLVGAQRHPVANGGLDMRSVTGAFLVGDTLYHRDASGTLLRRAWADGPIAGTSTAVSGPSLDGVDWTSRALFLHVS